MATIYPIKVLKDEDGKTFVPYTTTNSVIVDETHRLQDVLDVKLDPDNVLAGGDIKVTPGTDNVKIDWVRPKNLTVVNNVTTSTAGQGVLDASQGKILNDKFNNYILLTQKGAANGVATLGSDGIVPASQLPSYVDDVVEAYIVSGSTALSKTWLSKTSTGSALTPEEGKIYVVMTAGEYQNKQYRWGGSTYVLCNPSDVNSVNGMTGVITLKKLTIKKNGTQVGDTFNGSTDEEINITVPTNNNELTNGAGYQTAAQVQTLIDENTKSYYGTCATAASTAAKVVVCEGFKLETGARIAVKFTNAQTYNGTATLNVNSTGAVDICRVGTTKSTRYYWSAGEVIDFIYDGTNYVMEGKGTATTSYYGVTKLATSTVSTSTSTALTPASLNNAMRYIVTGYAPYSTSATYAVGDRVRYSNYVYECITAITTAEAWTADHWKQVDDLQTQINGKQEALVSGTNIKTVNGTSLLGSGNIAITVPTKVSELTNDSKYITASASITGNAATATTASKTTGTLTVQTNGTSAGTFNGSENKTINITIPTKVSELNNDSKFISSVPTASTTTAGIIKIGTGLAINSDGVAYVTGEGVIPESIDWDKVNGKPTNVSYWTNDAGYITSSGNVATATTASKTTGTLTIQKNGTNVDTFNGSSNKTINITVPTNNNQLTNGAGYITASGSITGNAATATTATKLGSVTIGSTSQPIYLNNGVPTVCDSLSADNYLPLSGGTMTGSIIMNGGTNSQKTEPYLQWKTVGSNTPYIGFATDQVDGTFIVGSLKGTAYATGLAIGGGSTNLLWKGSRVLTAAQGENLTLLGINALPSEINRVQGVTSNIQTQLDSKASTTYVDTAIDTAIGGALAASY